VDASRRWRGKPGDGYKDWAVISISFKSIYVTWAVITKNINEISTRFLKKKAKEASSPPKKNKEALKKAKEAFLKKLQYAKKI